MASKVQDDKNMKILRQLSNEPDNKKCMDCGIKGTVYVCSNFNTFICTACSGLHREFNHRVKSISMTTFKPEEIKNLQAGGNAVARRKWLAKWSSQDFPEPDPSDSQRVKAFMKLKYIDKRWYSETGEGPAPSAPSQHHQHAPPQSGRPVSAPKESYPQPVPLTSILGNDIPPIHINGANNKQPTHQQPPVHQPPPPANNTSSAQNNLVDWNSKPQPTKVASDLDELLSMPSPAQQQQYQQQLHNQQQQNMYQQQQQLIMSQFAQQQQQPGAWGGAGQGAQGGGFFGGGNPYAAQTPFGQPQQPGGGFFGAPVVQTPPNFFTPGQQSTAPTNPYGNPSPSPTFGQPTAPSSSSNPYASARLSPTPIIQPGGGAFGMLSPAQPSPAFGATMSPAQPAPGFGGGSPSLQAQHIAVGSGGFGQTLQPGSGAFGQPAGTGSFGAQPSLTAAQPNPADKYNDIFASLSPLNKTSAPPQPNKRASGQLLPLSHQPSSSNPNPFGDPFGMSTAPPAQQQQHQQQQQQNNDPFGFGAPAKTSPGLTAQPGPGMNNQQNHTQDLFGMGGGFGTQQPQQQQQHASANNNSNPFGGLDGFGAQPSSAQSGFGAQPSSAQSGFGAQPPPAQSSAFSPFNANPFGGQPQQQQPQQQAQQSDPFANPFF